MQLRPGDRVVLKLAERKVISPYADKYEELMTFDIIAIDPFGYCLFVPPHVFMKDAFKVDRLMIKALNMHPKYLNDEVISVVENMIYRVSSQMQGCKCSRCEDFAWGAAPNQEDGSFLCYLCRDNPWR